MKVCDVLCYVVEPIPIRDGEPAQALRYGTLSEMPDYEKRLRKNIGEPFQVEAWKISQDGEMLAKPLLLEAGTHPIIRLEDWFSQCQKRYNHVFEGKAWNKEATEEYERKQAEKKHGHPSSDSALMELVLKQGQQIEEMAKEIARLTGSAGTESEQSDDADVEPEADVDLSSYTKEELVDLARDRYGVDLSMGLNKPTMIATIQAHVTE